MKWKIGLDTSVLHTSAKGSLVDYYSDRGYTPFDMHFHTNSSRDSVSKPDLVLKKAKRHAIGVAITDHNSISGMAKMWSNKDGVPIIPGVEVTCREGTHMLYYFKNLVDLKKFFNKEVRPNMRRNSFFADVATDVLLKRSKGYPCVVCAPHPFAPGITGIGKLDLPISTLQLLDAVEGINSYNISRFNKKAIAWAKKLRKPVTAGSDGHAVFELGKCLTFLKGNTVETYLDSLKRGESIVVGTEESIFWKCVMTLEKEEVYLKNAHKTHETLKLFESQFLTEYEFFRSKFRNRKKMLVDEYQKHHG